MKRIAILIIMLFVVVPAGAQVAQTSAFYYESGPVFDPYKTLAPAAACTSAYMPWAWAGSVSSQIYVGGLAGDSVIIETKFKQSNYNAVAAWKVNADSIVVVDSMIGPGYGKLAAMSTKIDETLGGVFIYKSRSWTDDTAKYFQAYKLLTPATF